VTSENLTAGEAARVIRGGLLFQFEEFHGNDRTCGDCHRPLSNFDLAPHDVAVVHAVDPHNPLFRSVDADVEGGSTYANMIDDGLVRVHVVAAPNVTIDSGPGVSVRPDGRYVVALRRSTPSVLNAGLEEHLMWDGREGTDLAHQALDAAIDHAQVTAAHLPTASQLGDIAFFQEHLFSSPSIAAFAGGGSPAALPDIPASSHGSLADSRRRGRTFFVSGPLNSADMAHRGLCATCHSGPMLNTTNEFNPGDPPGRRFAGNLTSEINARSLPVYTFHVALPQDLVMPPGLPIPIPPGTLIAPAGTPITLHSPDPGALIVDTDPTDASALANPCISLVPCLLTVLGIAPQPVAFHRIPSLWGTADTAPYFHDNSANTFEEVVDHYRNGFFVETRGSLLGTAAQLEAAGDPATAAFLRSVADTLVVSDQDRADIAAYMRYAFQVTH